jgi:hypothetical protein
LVKQAVFNVHEDDGINLIAGTDNHSPLAVDVRHLNAHAPFSCTGFAEKAKQKRYDALTGYNRLDGSCRFTPSVA